MSTTINKMVFGKAMDAALDGPEQEGLKFRNHGFQVRTITKTPNGKGTHVEGHMFHQVNNFFDDKILYSFDVLNGQAENIKIAFKNGTKKLEELVTDALEAGADIVFKTDSPTSAPSSSGKIPRTEPALGTLPLLKDDGWKAEARFLVANIAFRVPRNA